MTLTIYLIECKTTKHRYYGTTKSQQKNFNPMMWFLRQNKEHDYYQKFAESVEKYGLNDHVVRTITCDYDDDKKLDIVYKKVLAMLKRGESLNDIAVSPLKVECEKCGMKVRKQFIDKHMDKYCTAAKNLEDFLELEEL